VTWFAGCAAVLLGAAWWTATRLRIAVVAGHSMWPTLRDGDRVLVRRVRPAALRGGEVVLVAMPGPAGDGWVVKRVAALPGDPAPTVVSRHGGPVPAGMLALLGDNPESSADSRDFGYVPAERLFGVMIRRL
jgi:signal peptidase I